MTIGKLIRTLTKLQAKYGDRIAVCVDKPSFWDGNKTFDICDITNVLDEMVVMEDGDGFALTTKRGVEIQRHTIVLSGGQNLNMKGERV